MEIKCFKRTSPPDSDIPQSEAKRIQHCSLSGIVFTYQDGRIAQLEIQAGNAAEILDFNSADLHKLPITGLTGLLPFQGPGERQTDLPVTCVRMSRAHCYWVTTIRTFAGSRPFKR